MGEFASAVLGGAFGGVAAATVFQAVDRAVKNQGPGKPYSTFFWRAVAGASGAAAQAAVTNSIKNDDSKHEN